MREIRGGGPEWDITRLKNRLNITEASMVFKATLQTNPVY
jgi:hypothetical protein